MNTQILVSQSELCRRLGFSPMTLWRRRQEPDFPKPVIIAGHCHFVVDEIIAWVKAQPRGSIGRKPPGTIEARAA